MKFVKKNKKGLSIVGGALLLIVGLGSLIFFKPNTAITEDLEEVYLADSLSYDQIKEQLLEENIIHWGWTFDIVTWAYGYQEEYEPGLFIIRKGYSNREMMLKFQDHPNESVEIQIRSFQKRKNVLRHLCKPLDIKYSALQQVMRDTTVLNNLDSCFNKDNIYSIFIPDTLWIHKNARVKDVLGQLVRKYRAFWTPLRIKKAEKLGLTCEEVCALASIVDAETNHEDEMPKIAGLYLNRYRDGKRLQADPTVVFALGKSVRRIRKWHTRLKSPYNTYRYKGLPPGPVFTPSIAAIDATLSPSTHDYYFFCARPDNSGYHKFTKTYAEHRKVSKKYHAMLNKRHIK